MRIILVHDGQDEDNAAGILSGRRDQPLTELGRAQIREAAERIDEMDFSIERILCSPLRRSRESAEIISKTISGPSPEPEDRLTARDLGVLTGHPFEDIPKYATTMLQTESIDCFLEAPQAESLQFLNLRAKRLLQQLEESNPEDTMVLVTHGSMCSMIRAVWNKSGWYDAIMLGNLSSEVPMLLQRGQ